MINSAEEFVALRTSSSLEEQRRAGVESTSLEVWLEVIDKFPELKEWVAYNKTVPMEILEQLASDPDPSVRRSVAMKRKLTVELLTQLAEDSDEIVRSSVGSHHKATPEILQSLLSDESWVVRDRAAKSLYAYSSKMRKAGNFDDEYKYQSMGVVYAHQTVKSVENLLGSSQRGNLLSLVDIPRANPTQISLTFDEHVPLTITWDEVYNSAVSELGHVVRQGEDYTLELKYRKRDRALAEIVLVTGPRSFTTTSWAIPTEVVQLPGSEIRVGTNEDVDLAVHYTPNEVVLQFTAEENPYYELAENVKAQAKDNALSSLIIEWSPAQWSRVLGS